MIRRARIGWPRSRRRKRIDKATVADAEAVILNMEPLRREILLLHGIERLSYVDIGAQLSLSTAEVRRNIAEAVHELACGLATLEAERGSDSGI